MRIRFASLSYDGSNGKPDQTLWLCPFSVVGRDGEQIEGVARMRARSVDRKSPERVDLPDLPPWIDLDTMKAAARAYRTLVFDERIMPPTGMLMSSGTIPQSATYQLERTYSFKVGPDGWEVVGWS